MEAVVEEDPHKTTLTKQAALWFRIDGHLDRMLTAVKHLAALTTRMENRGHHGPVDYEQNPQPYVVYGGHIGPPQRGEPSWQKYLLGIVVGFGIPSIGGILWSMNTNQTETNVRLSRIEERQLAEHNMTNQSLEQINQHFRATDGRVDAIERELWPHKH